MTNISTFELGGKSIDMTYKSKQIAYTFDHNGQKYGNSVIVKSKKIEDVMNATFLLLVNALETLEAIKEIK